MTKNKDNRVSITYKQDTGDAQKEIEIPFSSLVMSNLSGKPKEALKPLEIRPIEEIDFDNFNKRMKEINPRVAFQVEDTLTNKGVRSVEMTFENIEDFSPAQVARKMKGTKELLDAREQLANLKANLDGKSKAEDLLANLLNDPAQLESLLESAKSRQQEKNKDTENNLE